jgi:hypothetical protein
MNLKRVRRVLSYLEVMAARMSAQLAVEDWGH